MEQKPPKRTRVFGPLLLLAAVAGLLLLGTSQTVACGSGGSSSGDAVIKVITASDTRSFSLKDLEKLQAVEGYGGIKNSAGTITPPAKFKGVPVTSLLKALGGFPAGSGLTVAAKDGYAMTMSADQVQTGKFVTYDVSTGDEKTVDTPPQLVLAYEREGKPLDPNSDGMVRLVLLTPRGDEVTDGHWWIKWVASLEVKPEPAGWALKLDGAIQDQVDRASFDSCSAPNCHGVAWKDSQGTTWSGVPLYYLLGRADDQQKHGNGAFNSTLAAQGYQVEVVGANGKTTSLDSSKVALSKEYILANKAGGKELTSQDAPLRLVGAAIDEAASVEGVTEIRLLLK